MPISNFRQSYYLIPIIDVNSHTLWQTVQIQISGLLQIWIYTVCKGRTYLGSAGQGLNNQTHIPEYRPDQNTAREAVCSGSAWFALLLVVLIHCQVGTFSSNFRTRMHSSRKELLSTKNY